MKRRSHEPNSEHERWVIDGLEETPSGKVARVELPDGTTRDIELEHLPEGVREGDVLRVQDGPDGIAAKVEQSETVQARQKAQDKLEALNEAGAQAGGEINL